MASADWDQLLQVSEDLAATVKTCNPGTYGSPLHDHKSAALLQPQQE